jgi:DNA-binding transcriptional LysR family regulator
MEIRQIYYVLEVEKYKNFSKAADALFITQPTISHQIRELETEFGIKIFDRDTHGVKLTEDGKRFCKYSRSVVDSVDALMEAFDQSTMSAKATLRIGVFTFYKVTRLGRTISRFFASNANVIGSTRVTENYQAYDMLRSGKLDFAILKLRPEYKRSEFIYEELQNDVLNVLISRSDPLAAGREIFRLEELNGIPLITGEKDTHYYNEMKEMYDANGLEFNVSFASDDSDIVIDMVASGVGINLATASLGGSINDDRIVSIPIEPLQQIITYLIYPKNRRISGAELAFRNYILDAYAE